jgi:hypothetical protein
MIAFCCTHIARGDDLWQITRNAPMPTLPEESLDVTCRICTGLPESSFTVDDVIVLDVRHLEELLDRLLA